MCNSKKTLPTGRQVKTQRGISIYLAFMIMTLILAIALGASSLLISQFQSLKGIGYSAFALGAADAGIEYATYIDQSKCASSQDHVACLGANLVLSGNLANGASYALSVQAGGSGSCVGQNSYCVKSIGSFRSVQRALLITR